MTREQAIKDISTLDSALEIMRQRLLKGDTSGDTRQRINKLLDERLTLMAIRDGEIKIDATVKFKAPAKREKKGFPKLTQKEEEKYRDGYEHLRDDDEDEKGF